MTRYARALGSKACNAKVPEPSTPWCNLALKNATTQWSDSVEEESLEKKSPVVKLKKKVVKLNAPKVLTASKLGLKAPVKVPTPRKVEEKEIDDTVSTAMKGAEDNVVPTKRSRVEPISDCNIKLSSSSMGTVEETIEKGGSPDLPEIVQSEPSEAINQQVLANQKPVSIKKIKKVKPKEAKVEPMPNATVSPETAPETEDNPVEPPTGGNAEPKKPKNKRNKNKKKGVTPDSVTPTKPVESTELSATEPGAAETDRTDLKKSKKKKPKTESGQNSSDLKIDGAEAAKKPKKKEIKLISKEDIDQPSQSKVVLTDKEKEYLNQQTLKQLNEERFAKIRQTMVDSGMPQEKIDQKFLRIRRAIYKRLYVTVCRRCRRRGHVLRDCPETQFQAKSKCYKCGQSDHISKMCSIKAEVYTYADCFVCHQTGHLTRSCPNNKRGIYPRGGCCHICSEVTHLARDCPNRFAKKNADQKDEDEENKRHTFQPVAMALDQMTSADADESKATRKPTTALVTASKKRVVKF